MDSSTPPFKLTADERRQAFAGTLKVLRRPERPDQEPGAEIVLSSTRGGKQVLWPGNDFKSRKAREKLLEEGKRLTVEITPQPRLWVTIKGWHLRAGQSEWETDVTIHDRREENRQLASGALGGIPREPGLRTRWGETVDAEGKARPKRIRTREQQREHWTPETERGYGGGGGRSLDEHDADGRVYPAPAVDDNVLAKFAEQVDEDIKRRQALHRERAKLERKVSSPLHTETPGERSRREANERRLARISHEIEGDTEQRAAA